MNFVELNLNSFRAFMKHFYSFDLIEFFYKNSNKTVQGFFRNCNVLKLCPKSIPYNKILSICYLITHL